ncbi:hypothetical protein KEJ26_03790 [Candidatus Bathyarchaeota archaeon]|nr:hypothetical protein [Candidatus Bathyarchaeota archaeon]
MKKHRLQINLGHAGGIERNKFEGGKRCKVMDYRNRELARDLSNYIKTLAGEQHYLIMHVCGTQLPYVL